MGGQRAQARFQSRPLTAPFKGPLSLTPRGTPVQARFEGGQLELVRIAQADELEALKVALPRQDPHQRTPTKGPTRRDPPTGRDPPDGRGSPRRAPLPLPP